MSMEYLVPRSLGEALGYLAGKAGARVLAGGTDLAVVLAESMERTASIVDISRVPELLGIRKDAGGLDIGACVTIAEIARSAGMPLCLVQGAKSIGSPQIRNIATIGGNICNASPCGDSLAPLICLDAVFALVSAAGTREVPAGDFFLGPKKTLLREGEILARVRIGAVALEGRSAFRMIGKRNGQAISQVNAGVWLRLKDGLVADARAAAGSVAPVPLRCAKLESRLLGSRLDDPFLRELPLDEIGTLVNADIRPISDVRATEAYRRRVSAALFSDAIEEALR